MIRLDSTKKLQAYLAGAVATTQPQVSVSYSDVTTTAYAGASTLSTLNGVTAVDICAAPAATVIRDIDFISVANRDTAAITVNVVVDQSATDYLIIAARLEIGATLEYTHGSGWSVTDTGSSNTTGVIYLQFDTGSAAPAYSEGQAWWDQTNHTLTVDLENNVRMQLGQELPIPCTNNTGATILNGSCVYISGYGTDHMTVALAKSDSSTTSESVLGIATQDILHLAAGYITTLGFVRDIDTSAFTPGAAVYLSATVAGGLTQTRPTYPNLAVRMGYCGRSNATAGMIWVAPQVFPDAQQILLPASGTPSDSLNILDWFRHEASTGLADDGDITDGGATVSIAAADFYVREGTSEDDQIRVYRIAASSPIAVAANDVTYIYHDYNGGSPTWATGTTLADFNGIDKVIAFVVGRNSSIGQNNIIDLRKINVDSSRKSRRQKSEFDGFVFKGFWRSSVASSTLTSSGLNLSVGAGRYFYFDNPISHAAFDTAVAGVALPNVFSYFYNRTGTWTQITGSKTINTTQYDVGGVLTTLTNNRFRADWVYVVLCSAAPYLAVILGNAEYSSLALAQDAPLPTSLPPQFDGIGVLIGQVVIQKSAATVTTQQAGSATFAGGAVSSLPASSIVNTPAGNIAATDVQSALNELDTEKLAKSGDTASSLTITSADINGGTIDGTVIGATTRSAGSFTGVTIDNGNADGGEVTFKSQGFLDWSLDNSSGALRFIYNATVPFQVSASGVTCTHTNSTAAANVAIAGTNTANSSSASALAISTALSGGASTLQLRGVSNEATWTPAVSGMTGLGFIGATTYNNANPVASHYQYYGRMDFGAAQLGGTVGLVNIFTALAPSINAAATTNITTYAGFTSLNVSQGAAQTIGTVYSYYSGQQAGTNRWGFYEVGSANNAFYGNSSFGKVTAPTHAVDTTSFGTALITNTAATYTFLTTDHTVIQTTAASVHTLPAAASFPGRRLHILTQFAGTVTSASSNVVPIVGGAAGTAILAATAGKFATLQSNGTNWLIIAAN